MTQDIRTTRSTVLAVALTLLLSWIALGGSPAQAADGDPDTSFNANVAGVLNTWSGLHALGNTKAAVEQSDGKLVVAGNFGTPFGPIARFDADGTVDLSFSTAEGDFLANGFGYALAVQSDDKILMGGNANRLVRLNADGSPDSGFNANVGSALNGAVYGIAVQSDGKIIVTGAFTTPAKYLARFHADGTADAAFNASVGTTLGSVVSGGGVSLGSNGSTVAIQPDGAILVGGSFTTPSHYLARFAADGTPDTDFNESLGALLDDDVQTIDLQADGRILVGGWFTSPSASLARFESDGTPDADFNDTIGNVDSGILDVAVQPNGQIVAGGAFTTPSNYLARFNADGTSDAAFNSSIGTSLDDWVNEVLVQENGKIVVGGDFTTPSHFVARFDGTVPKTPQTIDFAALSDWSLGAGSRAVAATASSGLPVEFTSQTPATCSVTETTVTLLSTGSCTVRASQPGDEAYDRAEPVERSFSITAHPAQAASMTILGTTATWPTIGGAQQYYVMYRQVATNKPWAIFATATNLAAETVHLTNPGTRGTCSAANAALGYQNCSMVYGWARGKTYEFAVYSKNAAGKTSMLPLVPLTSYRVP